MVSKLPKYHCISSQFFSKIFNLTLILLLFHKCKDQLIWLHLPKPIFFLYFIFSTFTIFPQLLKESFCFFFILKEHHWWQSFPFKVYIFFLPIFVFGQIPCFLIPFSQFFCSLSSKNRKSNSKALCFPPCFIFSSDTWDIWRSFAFGFCRRDTLCTHCDHMGTECKGCKEKPLIRNIPYKNWIPTLTNLL